MAQLSLVKGNQASLSLTVITLTKGNLIKATLGQIRVISQVLANCALT